MNALGTAPTKPARAPTRNWPRLLAPTPHPALHCRSGMLYPIATVAVASVTDRTANSDSARRLVALSRQKGFGAQKWPGLCRQRRPGAERDPERDQALAAACRHGPAPPPPPATRAARAVSAMAVAGAPAGGPCAPALEALLGAGALRLLDSSQIVIISTAQDASAPPAPAGPAAPAAGPCDPDLLLFATPQAPRPTPSAPRPALGRPPVRTPGTLGRMCCLDPHADPGGARFWDGRQLGRGRGGLRRRGWAVPRLGWVSRPLPGVRSDLGPVPVCSSAVGFSFLTGAGQTQ